MDLFKSRQFWTILVTIILDGAGLIINQTVTEPSQKAMAVWAMGSVTTMATFLIAKFTVDDTKNLIRRGWNRVATDTKLKKENSEQ